MKLTNKQIKNLILIIFIFLTITFIAVLNHKNKSNHTTEFNNSYITLSDVKQIELSQNVIVINKLTLNAAQEKLLDIDKNNKIDESDISIYKDIINHNIKDLNKDGVIDNNDLNFLKKTLLQSDNNNNKEYDLNYDNVLDELDVDLLQRYINNIIDLDVNGDNKENYEDINLLETYINSTAQLKILLPQNYTNTEVSWSIDDKNIIKTDDQANIYPLQEGITKITVKDYNDYTAECTVIVINSNITTDAIELNKSEIYLKSASLTTVEKSAADINQDNQINALDLKVLKDIIKLKFGDINNDGKINENDLQLLNQYIKNDQKTTNNYEQFDINQDGFVNNQDYEILNEYLFGNKLGDINKDNQVENRDIKIVSGYINSYYPLYVKFNPSNTSNKKISWKSSNTNVATVTNEGVVYAIKEGTAIISATTSDKKTAECRVIVSENNITPYKLENNNKEIELIFFDYKQNDILKIDFNSDGIITIEDKNIAKKLMNLKNPNKGLDQILEYLINNKKIDDRYDLNQDKKIDISDYNILYKYVNKLKTGDVNNDKKFDDKDISLIDDYINSTKNIQTKVYEEKSIDKIIYLVKNANIVNVDEEGNIKALNKGTTEIAAMSINGVVDSTKIIVK